MQNVAYVHTNGLITFQSTCTACLIVPFPASNVPPSVAVLWQVFDTASRGGIFYRVTSDPELMYQVYSIVLQEMNVIFDPEYAIVVTWNDVQEWFPVPRLQADNSFQAIIATDGVTTYVALFYREVDLARAAQVGFNAGDDVGYFLVASLRDASSQGIQSRSNLQSYDRPGFYVYRIDSE